MSDKAKRRLVAQHKRLTGKPYPDAPTVFYGTIADLYRQTIRKLGEEPHA